MSADMPLGWNSLRQVLCLGAHADDIEIGCGGTIMSLIEAFPKLEITWVILSGDQLRAEEARRSCELFCRGAARVELVQQTFPDSFLPAEWQTVKQFFQQLAARTQPDLVFTHRREDRHQDHRVAAELTWNAFRGRTILEYEIPKWEGDLGQPNVYVPLRQEIAQRKADALMQHFPSQADRPWFDREAFLGVARLRGLEANSPTRFAEGFYASKLIVSLEE